MKPRFPRADLPPLPEVRELESTPLPNNQWAMQIMDKANGEGKETAFNKKPKKQIVRYQWEHYYRD